MHLKRFGWAVGVVGAAWLPLQAHGQIAQEPGYQLVYSLDIGAIPYNSGGAATFDSTGASYSVNNAGSIANGSFTRVAYELTLSGSTNPLSPNGTMWASFDTPSAVASQLGVPATPTGEYYNQSVSNMNVVTTLGGLSGTGITDGTIQFWPTNYGTNGATNNFDWNDCCGGATGGGYGHMDINEVVPGTGGASGQVLEAFSNWGGNGGLVNVGIGNRPGGGFQTDYTFANNAGDYSSAVLTVWVTPEPGSLSLLGLGAVGLLTRRRHA